MKYQLFVLLFAVLFIIKCTHGGNPFERGLPRYFCFQPRTDVENCTTTFVSEYPEHSRSISGSTVADTWMLLFTRRNPKNPERLELCGGRLPTNTYFNPRNPTVVVNHGFLDGICLNLWMIEYIDAFLCRGDYNVILIDWSWGNQVDFTVAIMNLDVLSSQINILLNNILNRYKEMSGKNIHLVGHSLGAQVSGIIGYKFQKSRNGEKVRRITGLDPSGPGFYDKSLDYRLDSSDAELVDNIHGNKGYCLPKLGQVPPNGHYDFYPNGGQIQLSCIPYIIISILKKHFRYGIENLLLDFCFHYQTVQYFKQSIIPECNSVGVECESYEDFKDGKCSCGEDGSNCFPMGMDIEMFLGKSRKDGAKLFLDTALLCPYCDNEKVQKAQLFQRSDGTECGKDAPEIAHRRNGKVCKKKNKQ